MKLNILPAVVLGTALHAAEEPPKEPGLVIGQQFENVPVAAAASPTTPLLHHIPPLMDVVVINEEIEAMDNPQVLGLPEFEEIFGDDK